LKAQSPKTLAGSQRSLSDQAGMRWEKFVFQVMEIALKISAERGNMAKCRDLGSVAFGVK